MEIEDIIKQMTDHLNGSKKESQKINGYLFSIVAAMFAAMIVFFDYSSITSTTAGLIFFVAIVSCAVSLICFVLAVVSPYFAHNEELNNLIIELTKKIVPTYNRKKKKKWNKSKPLLKCGLTCFIISIILLVVFAGINLYNYPVK